MTSSGDRSMTIIPRECEYFADRAWQQCSGILPHLARFLLVVTFIEDSFRMLFQWKTQAEQANSVWGCGTILANFYVIFNLLVEFGAPIMVLMRKKIPHAVALLFTSIVLQNMWAAHFLDIHFRLRCLSLTGGLLLLLVDHCGEEYISIEEGGQRGESKSGQQKTYLLLAGRLLLLFMYVTCLHLTTSPVHLLFDVVGGVLICMVTAGYKTRLSSLIMAIFLTVKNLAENTFWNYWMTTSPVWAVKNEEMEKWNLTDIQKHDYLEAMKSSHHNQSDAMMYNFFQVTSVIGGLMLLIVHGPGHASLDERKKK